MPNLDVLALLADIYGLDVRVWGVVLLITQAICLMLTVFNLPGLYLMVFAAGGYTWLTWDSGLSWQDQHFTPWALGGLVLLLATSEIVEFVAGMAGARKTGGSKRAAVGALIGGFVGAIVGTFAIPIPLFGSIVGAVLGAGLGGFMLELQAGRTGDQAVRVGVGAGVGRLIGTVAKLVFGFFMLAVTAVAVFWD